MINAKTLRKAKKDAKGDHSFFEVVFFAGFLYPFASSPKAPTFGALNPYNLCLGYKSDKERLLQKFRGSHLKKTL